MYARQIYKELLPTFKREAMEQKTYHIEDRDILAQEAYDQAVILQENKHYDGALATYKLARALFMEYDQDNTERYAQFKENVANCHFQCALIHLNKGNKDKAFIDFAIALEYNPVLVARFSERTRNTFKKYPDFYSNTIKPALDYVDLKKKLKKLLDSQESRKRTRDTLEGAESLILFSSTPSKKPLPPVPLFNQGTVKRK